MPCFEDDLINFINKTLNEKYSCDNLSSTSHKACIFVSCLEFAYEEGLLKNELSCFLTYFNELLNEFISVNEENCFTECSSILKSHIGKLSDNFNSRFLKSALKYILCTVIQHRSLYKIAFCKEQDVVITENLMVNIETINQLKPLADAKEINIWEKEQKLKNLEDKYLAKGEEIQIFGDEVMNKIQHDLAIYKSTLDQMEIVTVCDIKDVIVSIIKKNCELAAVNLDVLMEKSKFMLINRLEKAMI
ncbi:uncharacterized protein C8orf74 homolog [Hydra vulgaris]|uniref:Uncharacterized protein C8orf74 homolog n=1 Tax=Hydra vulgaris TaxID=6087 RepID=A0ABM4CVM0_HYDVU